jgi:hypothetical protein
MPSARRALRNHSLETDCRSASSKRECARNAPRGRWPWPWRCDGRRQTRTGFGKAFLALAPPHEPKGVSLEKDIRPCGLKLEAIRPIATTFEPRPRLEVIFYSGARGHRRRRSAWLKFAEVCSWKARAERSLPSFSTSSYAGLGISALDEIL